MVSFKVIEKKGVVFGMTFIEFGVSFGLSFSIFIMMNLASAVVELPGWYPLIPLLLGAGLAVLFRKSNEKKYPNYLMAMLSFKLFQAKRITYKGVYREKTLEEAKYDFQEKE